MNRAKIENLYEINGLTDYKLRNIEDILKIHEIDIKVVEGYSRLDDLSRSIYEKFIVNIFNAWGLESRATLIPKAIYYVEEIQHAAKVEPKEDYLTVIGITTYIIDRNGLKSVLKHWVDDDYKDIEPEESSIKNYLRFEYEHQGRSEWLHVINEGKEWY